MKPVLLLIPGMLNDGRVWADVAALLAGDADVLMAEVSRQDSIARMRGDAWAQLADVPDSVPVVVAGFWVDARRERKFRELDKMFRGFQVTEMVIPGREITAQYLFEIGEVHFASYDIHDREIEGFVDYVRKLDVVVIKVIAPNGDVVLHDVSVVLPQRNQVYGSFCQWNDQYRRISPGIYACLAVCEWGRDNGYHHYNLGPVGDYPYKELFVTTHQPIYAIALVSPRHALWKDQTSPLFTDFPSGSVNTLYRNATIASSLASDTVA